MSVHETRTREEMDSAVRNRAEEDLLQEIEAQYETGEISAEERDDRLRNLPDAVTKLSDERKTVIV